MLELEKEIQNELFAMQDLEYRDFHSRLMPTIDKNLIIGVRTPKLRSFAKSFSKNPQSKAYLKILPHKYYEENNLHAFLLEQIKDYDELILKLDMFLPFVDNWATCDLMKPKAFKNHKDNLLVKIREWIASDKTYTVRFGIEMLMSFYLDEGFKPEYLKMVSDLRSEEYYVNMMTAWFFATALAKQYASAIIYIEQHKLDSRTNNKAIQKAVESYRISPEKKEYLRKLKV